MFKFIATAFRTSRGFRKIPKTSVIVSSDRKYCIHNFKDEDNNIDSDGARQKRKAAYMDRKIYKGLNLTLDVFRDLQHKYSFLRITPPVVNIDVHQVSSSFWMRFASHTNDKYDLLEAWNLMASSSVVLESEEMEATKRKIVTRLCNSFEDFSYAELSDILFNLRILYSNPQLLKEFSQSLDKHLTEKMKLMLMKEEVLEGEIDQCLKVSFTWLRALMESEKFKLPKITEIVKSRDDITFKIKGIHNREMLKILLEKHIHSLNSQQLMFSLFLCGHQKRYPSNTHRVKKGETFPVSLLLYETLCNILPELSPREVGILFNSLHLSNLHLETEHATLRTAGLHCLINYDNSKVARDQFIISSLAKFLSKRGSENHLHCVKVMDKYRHHLSKFESYAIVRLLQFVVPGKPTKAESNQFLRALCSSLSSQLKSMRIKDLEILANGLYFLNNKEVTGDMSDKIAEAVLQCNWGDVRSGRSFVYLMQTLAKMGTIDIEGINTIMTAANKCKMERLDTVQGLSKAVEFLFELNIPLMRNVNTDYIIKSNKFLFRNSLFCLLQLDGMREIYNIDCMKLDPKLRGKLTKYFHALPEHNFDFNFQNYSNLEGNIDCKSFNETTKGFIHRDLTNILGGEEYIWTGHPYPHSTSSVIILKKVYGEFHPISEGFKTFTRDHIIKQRNDKREKFIVLVIPKKEHTDFDGNMLGPLETQMKDLKTLGYEPIFVHWVEYYRHLKIKRNLSYIRKLLKSK